MYQLRFQSKLLDKVDALRAIGVGTLMNCPRLIIFGNLSREKALS